MAGAKDTIFALSTPPGIGGIAVVRVSGPAAGPILRALTGSVLLRAREAKLVTLRDPSSKAAIDRCLVIWFPAPHSFTGEDMLELHLHGGRAVVANMIETLGRAKNVRLAEAGEFTHRAFDNGKLDLIEVEGLADLIAAETEAQRQQAYRQMAGELTQVVESWRERLGTAQARLSAAIDFPDDDLPAGLINEARQTLFMLTEEIGKQLADGGRGERLRRGYQIAILGPPNAGKSSLLNALAQREVAIVSSTAGTTRDIIEVHLDLKGYPVTLADTAGLRRQEGFDADSVEQEGMRRARQRALGADLKIMVFDILDWPALDPETLYMVDERTIVVLNKVDAATEIRESYDCQGHRCLLVSAQTGQGLQELLVQIGNRATKALGVAGSGPALTRQRHRQALKDCLAALERACSASKIDLLAEDLRLAQRALGRIAGHVDVEDLLDRIFSEFCIGK